MCFTTVNFTICFLCFTFIGSQVHSWAFSTSIDSYLAFLFNEILQCIILLLMELYGVPSSESNKKPEVDLRNNFMCFCIAFNIMKFANKPRNDDKSCLHKRLYSPKIMSNSSEMFEKKTQEDNNLKMIKPCTRWTFSAATSSVGF